MRRKFNGTFCFLSLLWVTQIYSFFFFCCSIYCPNKDKMPQTTFASQEELYSIFHFKNQIQTNQFMDDVDDDWECNDVSVTGKCFLEVDDRIKIEGNLVETTT